MCQDLEETAADDRVQRDAVDDEAVEALDDRIAGLQAEKDHVAAAANAGDRVVDARVLAGHLERHVDPDAVGERADLRGELGIVGEAGRSAMFLGVRTTSAPELLGHLGVARHAARRPR